MSDGVGPTVPKNAKAREFYKEALGTHAEAIEERQAERKIDGFMPDAPLVSDMELDDRQERMSKQAEERAKETKVLKEQFVEDRKKFGGEEVYRDIGTGYKPHIVRSGNRKVSRSGIARSGNGNFTSYPRV